VGRNLSLDPVICVEVDAGIVYLNTEIKIAFPLSAVHPVSFNE
jgi:hypothetical protein